MTRLGAIFIGCIAFAASVLAHKGHDDGAKPAAPTAEIPRLESTGADLELVATAAGHKLTIYLDRLATNEPVDGAEIEVSGDGIAPVTARRISEGTYEIDAAWVDEPGTKVDLTFDLPGDWLPVAVHGYVVRVDERPLCPGMAIRFTKVPNSARHRLVMFLAQRNDPSAGETGGESADA